MEHHYYLGVRNDKVGESCCFIDSLVPITKENFQEVIRYTIISSTDWGGHDDVKRTLKIKKMFYTPNRFKLDEPYGYKYTDYDHGHVYEGSFRFDEVREIISVVSEV